MARIPYCEIDKAPKPIQDLIAKLPPLNIMRMMAHGHTVMRPYLDLGGALLWKGELDPQLREMAILRVGYLSKAGYETYQHERISRQLGMPEEKIQALKVGADDSVLTDDEKLVVRFTDECVRDVRVSDATFDKAAKRFSRCELVELVMAVGFYMMTCRFLENFGVDIEEGDAPGLDINRGQLASD